MKIAEGTVGEDGGSVDAPGDLTIAFQPGSLPSREKVVVHRVSSTPDGAIYDVEREGGEGLLATPAKVTFVLPPDVVPEEAMVIQEVTDGFWISVPSTVDAASGTLTAEVWHFSKTGYLARGWSYLSSSARRVAQGIGSAGGVVVGIFAVEKFGLAVKVVSLGLTTISLPVSAGGVAVVGVCAVGGWFVAGKVYDMQQKWGLSGPIPALGFDVMWKQEDFPSRGPRVTVVADKDGNFVTALGKHKDEGAILPEGAKTFVIPAPVWSEMVPLLQETRGWYDDHGYNPPERIPVLAYAQTGEKATWGEWDGKYLYLNSSALVGQPEKLDNFMSSVPHEYWHAVWDHNEYPPETFVGTEEALAVAFESIVLPGCKSFLSEGISRWEECYAALGNGLVREGPDEGNSLPARRGYKLWPFAKFLYHRHGDEAVREYARGKTPPDRLKDRFRFFVESLLIDDETRTIADPLVEERPGADGKMKKVEIRTGWSDFTLRSQVTNSGSPIIHPPGRLDLRPPAPLSFLTRLFDVPHTANGPLVIRRERPADDETIIALLPTSADERNPDRARRLYAGDMASGKGSLALKTPSTRRWVDDRSLSTLLPVVVVCTEAHPVDPGPEANPLLVYRLAPPGRFRVEKVDVDGKPSVKFSWDPPALGTGLIPEDCLAGYRLVGKKKAESKEEIIGEFLFATRERPEAVAEAWYKGLPPSGRAMPRIVGLSRGQSSLVLPIDSVDPAAYESVGICSIDGLVRDVLDGSRPPAEQPLLSDVAWVSNAPPSPQLSILHGLIRMEFTVTVQDARVESAGHGLRSGQAVVSGPIAFHENLDWSGTSFRQVRSVPKFNPDDTRNKLKEVIEGEVSADGTTITRLVYSLYDVETLGNSGPRHVEVWAEIVDIPITVQKTDDDIWWAGGKIEGPDVGKSIVRLGFTRDEYGEKTVLKGYASKTMGKQEARIYVSFSIFGQSDGNR